jgi:hypothetical protein
MYPEDFEIPSVENQPTVYPEEVASERAFYTAGSYSNNPIDDYQKIYADLTQKGNSELFEISKKRWIEEQDVATKNTVASLIEDPTVDYNTKRNILTTYSLGGLITSDIKEKYIQKIATLDTNDDPVESVNQTEFSKNLPNLKAKLDLAISKQVIEDEESTFMAIAKGRALAGADILTGLGAGLLGVLHSIRKWDAVEGQKLTNELVEKWRIDPLSLKSEEVRNKIINTVGLLGIPSDKITEFVTETTGSANYGLVGGAVLDPLNLIGVPVVKGASKLAIPSKSPLAATAVANPKAAGDLAKAVLEDPSDLTAKSVGATKAQIINDSVLPSLLSEKEARLMPDVKDYFDQLDNAWQDSFREFRFDPNVQELAAERRADLDTVYSIVGKERGPVYIQSKSSIQNIDGNVYEGRAVFGKNSHYFYSDPTEVVDAFKAIKDDVASLPEELSKDVSIVDEVTGQSFKTPEEFNQYLSTKQDDINQFSVQWNWKKEYNDVGRLLFGEGAVTSSLSFGPGPLKGIDVSGIARSGMSGWLLNPGTLPKWFEQGAARIAPRAAKQESLILTNLQKHVANTRFPKELDELVHFAENEGRDSLFTLEELHSKFPYLKENQRKELFVSYASWRRFTHYLHDLVNLEARRKLYKDGFDKGLYVNGIYTGDPVATKFKFDKAPPKEVWDMEKNFPIQFQLNTRRLDEGNFDVGGRQLVRLKNPHSDPQTGKIYTHGLIDGAVVKTDILPDEVVPRLKGYSPLKTDENFYVKVTPKEVIVDGERIGDPVILEDSYSKVAGAARTKKEAELLRRELQSKDPDKVYSVRQDKSVNFNTLVEDLEAKAQLNRHAMQRGEKLPSWNGPARIEDRLTTLVKTVQSLSRQNAFSIWEDAFQDTFVRSYGDFLPDGEFPNTLSRIIPRPEMNDVTQRRFEEAQTLFKKYSKMRSFGTQGDQVVQTIMHKLADVFDNWRLPSDLLRKLGNKGNFIVSAAKIIPSTLFINFAPQRQWLVQMQTLLDLAAVNPIDGVRTFRDTLAIRGALMAMSDSYSKGSLSSIGKNLYETFGKTSSMTKKEFDDTVDAILKSGLLESIDLNMMVQGVVADLNQPLIRSNVSKVASAPVDAFTAVSRTSRKVGFDAAETMNRVGLWLVAKDLWKKNNPNKDWTTPKAREEISYEEWRLSGSMSRAGALAYQEGLVSMFMQFAAISQKLTMNVFQDNATALSPGQRARLAAVRLAMYGPRFGLPMGGMVNYYINSIEDPELQRQFKLAEQGLLDVAVNTLLTNVTGEETKVNFSAGFSPLSQWGLPQVEAFFEMAKLWDGKANTNPRFPALGAISSIEDTLNKFQGYFNTGNLTPENWNKIIYETAKLASGFSNFSKAQIMLATRDKYTSLGSPLGLNATAGEAYAQFFGFTTFREEDYREAGAAWSDRTMVLDEMAKDIHKQLVGIYQQFPDDYESQAKYISSLMTVLDGDRFGPQEKQEIFEKVINLDKQRHTTMSDSLLLKSLEKTALSNSDQLNKTRNLLLLNKTNNPETQKQYNNLLDLLQNRGNP